MNDDERFALLIEASQRLNRVSDYLAAQFSADMPDSASESHFKARYIIHSAGDRIIAELEAVRP